METAKSITTPEKNHLLILVLSYLKLVSFKNKYNMLIEIKISVKTNEIVLAIAWNFGTAMMLIIILIATPTNTTLL